MIESDLITFISIEISTTTVPLCHALFCDDDISQGGSDGSGRHSAAPMLTAIMSGGVGISGRELSLSC